MHYFPQCSFIHFPIIDSNSPLKVDIIIFFTNHISPAIPTLPNRSPPSLSKLHDFLYSHTEHFLHELYNFMRSPYDVAGYDRVVCYEVGGVVPEGRVCGIFFGDRLEHVLVFVFFQIFFRHCFIIPSNNNYPLCFSL